MKHILGILKVAELVEGDFCCAMECIGEDSAVCFLFTKAPNFQFNIGVASVYFESKDEENMDVNLNVATATEDLKILKPAV